MSQMVGYLRMAVAREFWHSDVEEGPYTYEKNRTERLGDRLLAPFHRPSDGLLKNINQPYMVTALTVTTIAGATFLFYPDQCSQFLVNWVPGISKLEPWMLKFGGFLVSQGLVLGAGLRSYGRFDNETLMRAYEEKRIQPVNIGSVVTGLIDR